MPKSGECWNQANRMITRGSCRRSAMFSFLPKVRREDFPIKYKLVAVVKENINGLEEDVIKLQSIREDKIYT